MGCTNSVQTEIMEEEILESPKASKAPVATQPKVQQKQPQPQPEPQPQPTQKVAEPKPEAKQEEPAQVPEPTEQIEEKSPKQEPPSPEQDDGKVDDIFPPQENPKYDLPTSVQSIEKQNRRRSEIRAQMREYRKQMLEAPTMHEDIQEEDELYKNLTGQDALNTFQELFEIDSVWTGVCEWDSDGTSLGLEFTVTSVPDSDGKMQVSRLYHVARGRSRPVDDIRIFEETIMIERVYADQLVFEYKEETPEGLELILRCSGRQEHNEIHLKRAYVKGVAKKRKKDDPDSEWVEGTFDFVRTFFKQAGRIIKQNSLDFDDEDRDEREDSTARITKRMSRYSEQFMHEIHTGRSSGIPASLAASLTSRSQAPQGLLSPQEIEEARENSRSSSSSFGV